MKRTPIRIAAAAAALFLGGCYSHSFPTANNFIRPTAADCRGTNPENCMRTDTVHVFSDMNGTLFPSGWSSRPDLRRLRTADSLFNATAGNPAARAFILRQQEEQLRDIAALSDGRGPGRIFILIHGYNNTQAEAELAYRLIEHRLDLKPADRVIRFYWDGLSGWWLGGAPIWFWATANSQLAGSHALRNVLRQFRDEQVFLIGHSRGTSVILSALGNPVYDPNFLRVTRDRRFDWVNDGFFAPESLEPNGNSFHILVAAPAVDRIDFCDASAQDEITGPYDCPTARLRVLGEHVESFRFTVNRRDPVLNKFVDLGRRFNPTRLGLMSDVAAQMSAHYRRMQPYCIAPQIFHTWTRYIRHPVFARMLDDAGIARERPPSDATFSCPASGEERRNLPGR